MTRVARRVFSDERALAEALHSTRRVEGFTHLFYRYPARFSPEFARQVIAELSTPGDSVLDPFMGGGTTVVEALAAGRRAIGIDINRLAHFVTGVKTTPLSAHDALKLEEWVDSMHLQPVASTASVSAQLDPRTRNLPEGVRRFFDTVLDSIHGLRLPRQRRLARCALLRVGQSGLDGKRHLPALKDMHAKLRKEVRGMIAGMQELVQAARSAGIPANKITASRALMQGSVADPAAQQTMRRYGASPSLVLTSPPYPGVHVLYHRWQVSGRRETPAPYWLAGLRDGHGASYYTMGSRSSFGLERYFATLREGFESLRTALSANTVVVQLVAFSQTEIQLPRYLAVLAEAGYREVRLPSLLASRNVRRVPNRRWYTNTQASSDAGHEVLLVHRVKG